MGNLNKSFALILILIMAVSSLSLLLVKPSFAQSIPKPSVPEFTVKFIDSSYEVATSNPYSGEKTTQPIIDRSIEISIKNQPSVNFYNVRMKGYYEENWTILYSDKHLPSVSNSQYTVLSYPATQFSNAPEGYLLGLFEKQLPVNGQVDFQVEAMSGAVQHNSTVNGGADSGSYTFIGVTSDWSSTKTITIAPYLFASPTPTSTVPEFPIFIILPLFAATFLMVFKLLQRKQLSKSL